MAKRFTESSKWCDKWFRSLKPEFKLAWIYILDQCDCAGVIDLDEELASFQIGAHVDWEAFYAITESRLIPISKGKLWVEGFIRFQYGRLSEHCQAHKPVFSLLEKYSLTERVLKGYQKATGGVLDKDKEKDKEQDKEKKGVQGETWTIPELLDTPNVRRLLDDFQSMRKRIGKPIKSLANASVGLKHFETVEHLEYALETCIANEYQGLKPEYRPKTNGHSKEAIPF